MSADRAAPRYCAAPWTQGVLRRTGALQVCCRNERKVGDWIADGVEAAWHAADARAFRADVLAGDADAECRTCLRNGGARSLAADVLDPYQRHRSTLFQSFGAPIPEIAALEAVIAAPDGLDPGVAAAVMSRYEATLRTLAYLYEGRGPRTELALEKLAVVGRVARSFVEGDLAPREVSPFRQIELSNRCNARCIQCLFLHTGELAEGATLSDELVERAFAAPGSILDFYMYGTELLFDARWKEVGARLRAEGVKLRLSSNGMLLTPANVAHLLDEDLAAHVNVSLDGATAATVEGIRVNVDFERVCRNVEGLIAAIDERGSAVQVALSFVLMRRNHREFARLVELAAALRGRRRTSVVVYCQGLENYAVEGYRQVLAAEHHARVPREELLASLDDARRASRRTGIPTSVFFSWPIEAFFAAGCPVPPFPTAPLEPRVRAEPHATRSPAAPRAALRPAT